MDPLLPDDDDAEPRPWLPLPVLAVLAGLGAVAVRLVGLLSDRPLWRDEAMIGLNLVQRDMQGLLEPLDWDQGAPLLWLLGMRGLIVLAGVAEELLRAPAFLAGVLTLPLVWRTAWRHLGALEALLALVILGFMPLHVYQSAELKPYALDALGAALLVGAFSASLRQLQRRPEPDPHDPFDGAGDELQGLSGRSLAVLLVLGVVMPWISLPTVFVLGGGGLVLLAGEARTGRWRSFGSLALVCGAWLASFVGQLLLQRALLADETLHDYWTTSEAFAPFPPRSAEDARILVELGLGLFIHPLRSPLVGELAVGERSGLVLGVVCLIGLAAVARRDRRLAWLTVLPVGLGFVASALGLFPMQGRLLMFWTPLLALLAGAGLAEAFRRARVPGRVLGWALLLGCLAAPLVGLVELAANGVEREELLEVLEPVREQAREGDVLWVYYGVRPAYLFYADATDGFDPAGLEVILGPDRADDVDEYLPHLDALDGRGRVWVLFGHDHETDFDGGEQRHHLRRLATHGEQLEEWRARGASLHLFDL